MLHEEGLYSVPWMGGRTIEVSEANMEKPDDTAHCQTIENMVSFQP